MRSDLPAGTVTFLFTDIEGSTRLLHELGPEAYRDALAEHRRLMRAAFGRHEGYEVDYEGDAFFVAFQSAAEAVAAAAEAQEALAGGPIRVRMGLHTGEPLLDPPKYVGAEVHRAARIMSAGHGGQILLSSETASLLDGAALTSLGSHRLKDFAEPVTIYQLGEGSFPRLKTIANSNLPTPASSFLGREGELYEADELLQQSRLLTVTGPGGAGKTRFALELATRARDERFSDYEDGIYSAFLSSLRDPALVLVTIAVSLGVHEQPGQSVAEALASHLQGKKLLLLLDNLEHVLEATRELSDLLSACPGLTLLCTSRERLRLQGERIYALPPLGEDESVSLFCERAQSEPDEATRELCRKLEGLPLAIELAAARTGVLSPQQILSRLSQRLDLLKGTRDADPRQETLRAAIEWSYDLLSPDEQRLLAGLSVFAGGSTLEAAEEVCDADIDSLESLVDKSLVRFTDGRYWMLETIREFAAEQLGASGEGETMRERHAEHFASLAEELEPPLMFIGDDAWIPRLTAETANLRAAIGFLADRPDATPQLRLVGSLFRFWLVAGLVAEGRDHAERALPRADPRQEPELRLKVLYAATICAPTLGDFDAGRRYDEERLAIARRIGDERTVAIALNDLGLDAREAGDLDAAESRFEESRELALRLGEQETVAVVAHNLANTALARRQYARARDLSEEAVEAADATGDPWRYVPLCVHGCALLGLGDSKRAARLFLSIVEPTHRVHGPIYARDVLDGLASAETRNGGIRAARLSGAADTATRECGGVRSEFQEQIVEATRRLGRQTFGAEAWEAAYAEGATMTLDEAIAYALEDGANA